MHVVVHVDLLLDLAFFQVGFAEEMLPGWGLGRVVEEHGECDCKEEDLLIVYGLGFCGLVLEIGAVVVSVVSSLEVFSFFFGKLGFLFF